MYRLEQSSACAAVDRDQRAGDVAGRVGGEKGHDGGNFVRIADTTERDLRQVVAARARLVELFEALGRDPSGRDRVDSDSLRAELAGQRLGPADETGADGIREGEVVDRLADGARGDVDDPPRFATSQVGKAEVRQPDGGEEQQRDRILERLVVDPVRSTRLRRSRGLVRSPCTASAPMRSASFSSSCRRRANMATLAPALSSSSAIARPMPEEAPQTIAVLPLRSVLGARFK